MQLLKKLPIRYTGELHEVKLINFSVEKSEVESLVPWNLVVRDFGGRAMISMVDVDLRHMHPTFLPEKMHFNYRHVGFRLLLEDSQRNSDGRNKGIFFLKSFTDQPLVVKGGQWMTDYNLELAGIVATNDMLALKQKEHFLHYVLDDHVPTSCPDLKAIVGALDRAYSADGGRLRMVKIQREKWPIEEVNCGYFRTNFFKTARFEGAFRVNETIYYEWTPPQLI